MCAPGLLFLLWQASSIQQLKCFDGGLTDSCRHEKCEVECPTLIQHAQFRFSMIESNIDDIPSIESIDGRDGGGVGWIAFGMDKLNLDGMHGMQERDGKDRIEDWDAWGVVVWVKRLL